MDTPSQATLLLMTYPLSMESVKVHLELLSVVYLGCLHRHHLSMHRCSFFGSASRWPSEFADNFDNVMTKFTVNIRTDA